MAPETDRGRVGPRLTGGFGIRREFAARIHGEGDAVKARVESHFTDSDVKLVTALDFSDGAGGFAGVSQRSAAGRRPLRIAETRIPQARMRARAV